MRRIASRRECSLWFQDSLIEVLICSLESIFTSHERKEAQSKANRDRPESVIPGPVSSLFNCEVGGREVSMFGIPSEFF